MPAQKRSLQENQAGDEQGEQHQEEQDSFLQNHAKQSRHERLELQGNEQLEEEQLEQQQGRAEDQKKEEIEAQGGEEEEDGDDSEETSSATSGEKTEFVFVELPEIRKDVQCPICLGIIKKTRTVMECLHRFCRECIDKSMRLGNNECPACRTHCASRRSLRDDPNYDTLIAALYPDIDKYEEEELAFHEEERTRNKQIQASIAQIFQRQSEALVKRRTLGKETAGAFMTRSQRNPRTAHLRRRRNYRGSEHHGSEDNEDDNDDNGGKDSSSTDERSVEVRQRRRKRRSGIRSSQPSSSAANSDGGCIENELEVGRESRGISPGLVWNTEMLAWGRGGARSNTRHGNASGCSNKSSRSARLNKLVEYLRSLQENNDELDVHLRLVSVDNQTMPNLQQPYLCCRPSLSVKQLCEDTTVTKLANSSTMLLNLGSVNPNPIQQISVRDYVSLHTPLQAEEVEILIVKEKLAIHGNQSPPKDQLQILEGQETLAGLRVNYTSNRNHMVLAYRQKRSS